jgi:two-component system chemotaxis sensor kinase CheA
VIVAFRAEARELLQGIGDAVLELEEASEAQQRRQIAARAFRSAHNIKGAAGSLGFVRVEQLVHALEDGFDALQTGRVGVSAEVADVMFSLLDVLNDAVATDQPEADEPTERDRQLIDQLRR